MPTSDKIISPGVFTNEIDQSFLPAAIGDIGACVVGPTVKGPAMIPTVVGSMGEFEQIFGEVLVSGSAKTTYLTSEAARNYLKHGNKLTVIRILDGTYVQATANVPTGSGTYYTGSTAQGQIDSGDISFKLHTHNQGEILNNQTSMSAATATLVAHATWDADEKITLVSSDGTSVEYTAKGSTTAASNEFDASGDANATAAALETCIDHASGHANKIDVAVSSATLTLTQFQPGTDGNTTITSTLTGGTVPAVFAGGAGPDGTSGILVSGSADNI